MNKTLTTILLVIAVLAVAAGIFFAGNLYGRANGFGFGMYGNYSMMRNMMSYNGRMMNGQGGMMQGYGYNNANVKPLTVDQTKQAAEKYLKSLDLSGLEVGEVMIFDNNAYVVVKETENGLGAFELLVDPASQTAYPERGPNMMWNLKYGGVNHQNMMGNGGMMTNTWDGTIPSNISAEMAVTPEQAIQYTQKYLDTNIAGATAATDPTQFYGYYTLDFTKDGKVIGMLSVNGYSGQIFLHTWHGTFIEESD